MDLGSWPLLRPWTTHIQSCIANKMSGVERNENKKTVENIKITVYEYLAQPPRWTCCAVPVGGSRRGPTELSWASPVPPAELPKHKGTLQGVQRWKFQNIRNSIFTWCGVLLLSIADQARPELNIDGQDKAVARGAPVTPFISDRGRNQFYIM